jgi:hypothetical protein
MRARNVGKHYLKISASLEMEYFFSKRTNSLQFPKFSISDGKNS